MKHEPDPPVADGGELVVVEIRDALARFPAHPAHTGVAGSFGLSVQTKTASLEDLLATLPGTSLDPDPVARMRRYLHEQAEIRHLLERRVEELLYRMDRTAFLTNVLAGACVALGFVAILGWMGAFGVFEVLGPETPTLQPPGTPQNVASPGAPASTPAAAPRKEKQP